MPAPEIFPVREIEEACHYLLREIRPTRSNTAQRKATGHCASSSPTPWPNTASSIRRTTSKSPPFAASAGSDRKIFIDPDGPVVTGNPTYLGAIQAWRAYQARFIPIPLDEEGMQVDRLEDVVKKETPRFIYVLPNFHNPGGHNPA
jgi:2-aminoadipate transaminase